MARLVVAVAALCASAQAQLGAAYGGGAAALYGGSMDDEMTLPAAVQPGATTPVDPAAPLTGPGCQYTSGKHKFDLSPMRRTDHDFTGTTAGGYAYRFNVCGNAVKVCNSQPSPAAKWRSTKCNNLGDPSTQELSLLDAANPRAGLKLTFKDGDICKKQVDGAMEISARQVTYELNCDYGQSPGKLREGGIKENSMCDYVIVFDTAHACPVGEGLRGQGLGFISLLLLGGAFYLAGGVYYNMRTHGAQGVEAIPNVREWEQLPGLVRDGAMYSLEKGKVGLAAGKEAYEAGLPRAIEGFGQLRAAAEPWLQSARDQWAAYRARSQYAPPGA